MNFKIWMAASLLIITQPVLATYSVIAVDIKTRQVGAAVTSCVGSMSTSIVAGLVPGYGVIAAQASVDPISLYNKNTAVQMLKQGKTATETLAFLNRSIDASKAANILKDGVSEKALEELSLIGDPMVQQRQYAIVTFSEAVNFTGSKTVSWSGALKGQSSRFRYSIQGNILTSPRVLEQAQKAFESEPGELARKLQSAIQAGASNGEGDARCTPTGKPSDSAYLKVMNADGTTFIELDNVGMDNALSDLRF